VVIRVVITVDLDTTLRQSLIMVVTPELTDQVMVLEPITTVIAQEVPEELDKELLLTFQTSLVSLAHLVMADSMADIVVDKELVLVGILVLLPHLVTTEVVVMAIPADIQVVLQAFHLCKDLAHPVTAALTLPILAVSDLLTAAPCSLLPTPTNPTPLDQSMQDSTSVMEDTLQSTSLLVLAKNIIPVQEIIHMVKGVVLVDMVLKDAIRQHK